jgi:hypothetical protein
MPEASHSLDPTGLQVIEVLLVEDDPGDVLITTEAFELSPMHSTLHVVGDGEQAMRFLRRTGEFTGAHLPGGDGHRGELPVARQRIHHQTGEPRSVHRSDPAG